MATKCDRNQPFFKARKAAPFNAISPFDMITQEQEELLSKLNHVTDLDVVHKQREANGNVALGVDVSAERKATPVFSGFLAYFPDAVNAVAQLSAQANEKHNPGEPLHWSKHKSNDHADCLVRHQMEVGVIDPDTGFDHAVAVAWRAMAQLQIMLEDKE